MAVDRLQKCIQLLAAGAERRASPGIGPASAQRRSTGRDTYRRSPAPSRSASQGSPCRPPPSLGRRSPPHPGRYPPWRRVPGRYRAAAGAHRTPSAAVRSAASPPLRCWHAAGVAVAAPPAPQWMLLPRRAGTSAPLSGPAARQRPRLAAAPPNSGGRLSDAAQDTPHRCRGKAAL